MFIPIETERLKLRAFFPSDAAVLFAYRNAPEVTRYQSWRLESVEEAQEFIRSQSKVEMNSPDTWFQLAITLLSTGELVGDCGLHFPTDKPNQTEIGITVAPAHARQGYAAEALHAVLGFLFDHLKKHRVFASVDPRNLASMALLVHVGMRQEAHFVESLWIDGAWVDDAIFGVLQREWIPRATE